MGWLIAGGLLAAGLLVLMLLPVRLSVAFRQSDWQAKLDLEVRYTFVRINHPVDVTDRVQTVLEHMWKRWRAKGEPVDPDLQESFRKMPNNKMLMAALPGLRRLGRATLCRKLVLKVEVGGSDAMDSALLAGAVWGGAGVLVGQVSRAVRLPRNAVSVAVLPDYSGRTWRVQADCILAVRLGKAIMAIIWMLRREASRGEVIAWVRDSLRRKGDQTSGRAPDRRPDEDGDGKP